MDNNDLRVILDPAIIDLKVEGTTKEEVLRYLAHDLLRSGYIDDVDQFISDIYLREAEGPTGMGDGISIPHGRSSAARKMGIAIGKTVHPIRWESDIADDGWQDTRIIFLFCVMADNSFIENHQTLLSQLGMKLASEARVVKLGACQSAQEIMATLLADEEELERVEGREEIVELEIDF